MGVGRAGWGPGHRSRSPTWCERGAQGLAVRAPLTNTLDVIETIIATTFLMRVHQS